MKKYLAVALMAIAFVMLSAGLAFANFGPHGGYAANTDACAGCHRAHTSISNVSWQDAGGNDHSALLVSSATTMSEFCYACHGDGAPGASTNVYSGVFDGGPSADAAGVNVTDATMYETNSSYDATLNGGGFYRLPNAADGTGYTLATSMHNMDAAGATDPIWGSGNSPQAVSGLTCTDCHDPHGSSNYRLLRDSIALVNGGATVGGYDADDQPTPFVISAEEGYPATSTVGWLKHDDGAAQMKAYKPNYTSPEYAYMAPGLVGGVVKQRSMSAWCSGCHTQYDVKGNVATGSDPYDYGSAEAALSLPGETLGARPRHRHPVNITLAAGDPTVAPEDRSLTVPVKLRGDALPLERRAGKTHTDVTDFQDYLGCLTCHRAHGVETTMTGWASASLDTTTASTPTSWFPVPDPARNGGVNPTRNTSSLLRANNRGVCELCHNK